MRGYSHRILVPSAEESPFQARIGTRRVILGETAKSFSNAETLEVVALLKVVSRIVRGGPMGHGIDVQLHFLRGLRFPDEHLPWWNQTGNQI